MGGLTDAADLPVLLHRPNRQSTTENGVAKLELMETVVLNGSIAYSGRTLRFKTLSSAIT